MRNFIFGAVTVLFIISQTQPADSTLFFATTLTAIPLTVIALFLKVKK